MRGVHRGRLAGLAQSAGRVLPQRLQHAVPGVATGPVENDQRLPDKALQQLHHPLGGQSGIGHHSLCCGQGPPAAEDRQPAEQHPLPLREQIVTPVHRAAQGPLPGVGGAVARGQHREPITHPVGQLERLQSGQPGCRQFQGQGNAVQPAANHSDRIECRPVRAQIGTHRGRPVQEQPGCGKVPDPLGWAPFGRDRQRRNGQLHFPGHSERLAAGRQYPYLRAALQDGLDQRGHRFDQVLAIVEHNQHVPPGQPADEHIARPVGHRSALDAHTHAVRERLDKHFRFGHGGKPNQPHAIGELRSDPPSRLHTQ